ncbi:hypothetical protein, partial [Pectobacterium wasabiae]|uniref:hypothetical protein n=1 Tax=Pectobacterium wasabiae TaxID=55208 RepID=UPI001C1E6FB5
FGGNYAADAVPSSVSGLADRLRHVPYVAQAFAASCGSSEASYLLSIIFTPDHGKNRESSRLVYKEQD